MQSARHAVPAGAGLAVAVVPFVVTGAAAPAVQDPHPVAAALDAQVTRDAAPARPLVTRIIRRAARKSYTIVSGDTLSGIAGGKCGSARKWPGIWGQNKAKIKNPDVIYPGTVLHYTCEAPAATVTQAAMAAIPAPAAATAPVSAVAPVAAVAVRHDQFDGQHGACGDGDGDGFDMPCSQLHRPQAAMAAVPAPSRARAVVTGMSGMVGTAGMGAMQACIIARESGGNSQVMNASGHYGLYQFAYATWVGHGGSPGTFGHASVAEQNQVYASTVAADGYSDWAPYDGC